MSHHLRREDRLEIEDRKHSNNRDVLLTIVPHRQLKHGKRRRMQRVRYLNQPLLFTILQMGVAHEQFLGILYGWFDILAGLSGTVVV